MSHLKWWSMIIFKYLTLLTLLIISLLSCNWKIISRLALWLQNVTVTVSFTLNFIFFLKPWVGSNIRWSWVWILSRTVTLKLKINIPFGEIYNVWYDQACIRLMRFSQSTLRKLNRIGDDVNRIRDDLNRFIFSV